VFAGTFSVGSATTLNCSWLFWQEASFGRVRFSLVTSRARASRNVIDYGTLGVRRAVAWVTAVLFTASQSAGTVIIHQTFRLATSTVRIAFVTFGAETLRTVKVDTAKSIRTTRFENAWILTLAVNASFVRRTIGIGSATNLETLDLRIAGESFGADADWTVLDNSAFGVGSANTGPLEARINTALFDASLSGLTVRIDFTFGLDDRCFNGSWSRLATDERITSVAVRARANWVVANDLTASIETASSRARIFTFLGDASIIVGTVRVGNALGFTGHVRIAKQAW